MVTTIALGELVAEAVPGRSVRSLVTRPTGQAVRLRIEAALAGSGATILHDHQDEEIDHVLTRRNLAVLAFKDSASRPRLLGNVRAEHRLVFDALVDHGGPGDAQTLAIRLGRSVDLVADALQALALYGVVWAAEGTYQPLVYTA